jgi:hypothetical protein
MTTDKTDKEQKSTSIQPATASQIARGLPAPVTVAPKNYDPIQAWHEKCREIGTHEGKGARINWFMDLGERAYKKELVENQIAAGYDAYQDARLAANPNARARRKAVKNSDRNIRISEALRFVKVAQLPTIDGLKAINNCLAFVRSLPAGGDIKGDTDELMLKLMRLQLQSKHQGGLLTQTEMRQHLRGEPQPEKEEIDKLRTLHKQLSKLAKEHSWDPHKRSAASSLAARIEQLEKKK